MQPSLEGSRFPLIQTALRHTAGRALCFALVRGVLSLADKYYPGTLQSQLWSTVAFKSYLTQFYTGDLKWSFTRYVLVDSLVWLISVLAAILFYGHDAVRFCFASRRLSELEAYRSLATVGHLQLLPEILLKLLASPGEDLLPDLIRSKRALMSPSAILTEWRIMNKISMLRAVPSHPTYQPTTTSRLSFATILNITGDLIVPSMSLTLGSAFGKYLKEKGLGEGFHNGVVYNTAHAMLFFSSNLWLIFRIAVLPSILNKWAPTLARNDYVPIPPELMRIEQISRTVFEGKSSEELVRIKIELTKAAKGDTSASVVIGQGDMPTPEQAKELLTCLMRYERRTERVRDWIHVNSKLLLAEDMAKGAGQCCICLVEFTPQTRIRQLSCKHFFCSSCIEQWLLKEDVCPLCKGKVLTTRPWPQALVFYCIHYMQSFLAISFSNTDTDFLEELPYIAWQAFKQLFVK